MNPIDSASVMTICYDALNEMTVSETIEYESVVGYGTLEKPVTSCNVGSCTVSDDPGIGHLMSG